ncbi:MAG: hypothetical protein IJ530_08525 [Treponema sp.]|uniref:hypothetical protein n=1 Tax=Treponema sp. TaxID=166 RepID=UPI0025D628B0|nr:hypothetical protein [Treponema sp.]MBQ8679797.1 hypothetical protein [Treponema sp.]
MKKSRIFLALAGLALIFAGCSDISTGDSSVSSGYSTSSAESKTIKVNATGDNSIIEFPVSTDGRTILPAAVDASGENVKFYLVYKDMLATTPTDTWKGEVNFTASTGSTTTGTIDISFDVSFYKFTLYCCPASASVTSPATAATNAMFVGWANADLRYQDEITFYLSADGCKGAGTVNLKLYSANDPNDLTTLWTVPVGYTVTAGLYSKIDSTACLYPTSGAASVLSTTSAASSINGVDFSTTNVAAGTYNFVVTFTIGTGDTAKNYYYSDEILVLPNQATTGNVCIPEVLEAAPKAPSAFIVAYADPLTADDPYYYAQFAWSDNSNNERYFEIDLLNVSDSTDNTQSASPSYKLTTAPKTYAEWTAALSTYGKTATDVETYAWDTYQTSSLNPNQDQYSLVMNNTTAVFMLPLGERYLARIRAVNDVNKNDQEADREYAYVVIEGLDDTTTSGKITYTDENGTPSDTTDDTSSEITVANAYLSSSAIDMKKFEDDVYTINRYRVKYNLNGGVFKGAATTNAGVTTYAALTAATTPTTVVYETQKGKTSGTSYIPVGEVILNPDGDKNTGTDYIAVDVAGTHQITGAELNLVADGQKFSKWLLYSIQDSGNLSTDGGNRYPRVQYWWDDTATAWSTTETSGVATRYIPNAYTGHTNIELFANYALDTTASVTVADYTAFEWLGYGDVYSDGTNTVTTKINTTNSSVYPYLDVAALKYHTDSSTSVDVTLSTVSDVSLTGTGADGTSKKYFDELASDGTNKTLCSKGISVQVSATSSPTITFTLNKSACEYDNVYLKIRRTDSSYETYTYKKDWTTPSATYTEGTGWSASPASWDINVKAWKTGKYEVILVGTTSKYPNKLYSFPMLIDLVN